MSGVAHSSKVVGPTTFREAQDILTFLARHWNTIAAKLLKADVYVPQVYEDESGVVMGNDWAIGFELGMKLRSKSWDKLVEDRDCGAALAAMKLPAREQQPDPELHGTPLTPERGERLLFEMTLCVRAIYQFSRCRRLGVNLSPGAKRKKSKAR